MGKKYIVELEDNKLAYTAIIIDGVPYIKPLQLLPYTEPDLEQVRKEACEKGWKEAEDHYEKGYNDGYDTGLSHAWEAARKICLNECDGGMSATEVNNIFKVGFYRDALLRYSASEAIEKIRQYEQEEKMDGLRQNIQTIVDKCGYTLDEIAAVLKKMREEE